MMNVHTTYVCLFDYIHIMLLFSYLNKYADENLRQQATDILLQ